METILTDYPAFGIILIFITGLCVGSFLNVMAIRLLADESFVYPPSHCTKCNTPLKVIHNIPVISYILLGGQCAFCKTDISIQYPLTELATGLLFALSLWHFGLGWQLLFVLFLVSNLIVIFLTDLKESLIYQVNSLSLVPAGLLYHLLGLSGSKVVTSINLGTVVFHIPEPIISSLLGIILAIVFFEGLILLSKITFGEEGFGHGDTHLMMGAGAFLGWQGMLMALFLGFIIQAVPAIPMLIGQWIKNRQYATLASGGSAVAFGAFPMALMSTDIPLDIRTLLSLVSLGLSVIALVAFLRTIKTKATFTYLPLGPALIIGILLVLYCAIPLKSYYLQVIGG